MLFEACRLAAESEGIDLIPPVSHTATLPEIAGASSVRWRQVRLRGAWWHTDNGALVATLREGGQPVALLTAPSGRYILHNPATGDRLPVDAALVANLEESAVMFYRPLPDKPLTLWELLRFGLSIRDLKRIIVAGLMSGLVQLLLPFLARIVFDDIIPSGNRARLGEIVAALLMAALALALLNLAQGLAVIRLENRMEIVLQSALIDRLLRLPLHFFRTYTAGDLSSRVLTISAVMHTLSGTVLLMLFSTVFSLMSLMLMVIYDAQLAILAAGLVILGTLLTGIVSYQTLYYRQKISALDGQRTGFLFQILAGMTRVRLANLEERVFSRWSKMFTDVRALMTGEGRLRTLAGVFNAVFPLLSLMVIYAAAGYHADLSAGTFLGFSVASAQLTASWLALSRSLITVLAVLPQYERIRPLLTAEREKVRPSPGELSGAIEVRDVSFSYGEDLPPALQGISLNINPGEFVALVGMSGSGKSTLMRLLIGLEEPQSGGIYYDGRALKTLDAHQVRQQMGVVLQSSRLPGGMSIAAYLLENSDYGLDDAWEALRLSGIDEEVRHLPMNIQTIIADSGSTFSGGQRQRLLLARALVSRPRILLLDEATRMLDNQTQEVIQHNLASLKMSRLVIAHRLSTVMNADKIIVLDKGRISQTGSYSDLIRQPGLFAELVRQQQL